MNVLIACERFGAVRDAFIRAGHNAWSCDTEPGEGYYSNCHIQDDIGRVLGWYDVPPGWGYRLPNGRLVWPNHWDLMIAFPPCTYLTCSAEWAYADNPKRNIRSGTLVGAERRAARENALAFFRRLLNAPIFRIAVENPVGVAGTRIRPADQYIQPYQFGHDASKKTGLWLKNLPKLKAHPAWYVEPRLVNGKPRWSNQTDSGQNRLGPSPDRAALRGQTYAGIATAMAEQWG